MKLAVAVCRDRPRWGAAILSLFGDFEIDATLDGWGAAMSRLQIVTRHAMMTTSLGIQLVQVKDCRRVGRRLAETGLRAS